MNPFIYPLLGGMLIGLAATILLLVCGRIMGVSGIVWTAMSSRQDSLWRWAFIVGLILGSYLFHMASGEPNPSVNPSGYFSAIFGGLLVGLGVKLGSGCTSGHGVCGIARLSMRSIVATITFIMAGILAVLLTKFVYR